MTGAAAPRADEHAYGAAVAGVALRDAATAVRLHFSGADHLDFLHRMSTNHVAGLAVGGGLRTVFCDHRGRIVEVATLCRPDADHTVAFLDPGGDALLAWLDRYHFGERVDGVDRSGDDGQLELVGPEAPALVRRVLGADVTGVDDLAAVAVDGIWAQRVKRPAHPGVRLWGLAEPVAELAGRLAGEGAVPVDAATWEVLRVEAGCAARDRELTLEHNPWEADLRDAVHQNKGCYVGQEVVARLDAYRKVKQRLVGLRLTGPVATGTEVQVAGCQVGVVTSTALSPRLGPLALAYVRTAHCHAGTAVAVGGAVSTVATLPFTAGAGL